MSSIKNTLTRAHQALADAGIDHALIGGLALGGLGVHRATLDVDFLVSGADRMRTIETLVSHGFALDSETAETLHFSGYGPLDILLANRPASRGMLDRAMVLPTLGIKCLRAEDIIGLKIQAYVNNPRRELQDKADIAALIGKHRDMDWDRIKAYADLFAEWPALARLRNQYDV